MKDPGPCTGARCATFWLSSIALCACVLSHVLLSGSWQWLSVQFGILGSALAIAAFVDCCGLLPRRVGICYLAVRIVLIQICIFSLVSIFGGPLMPSLASGAHKSMADSGLLLAQTLQTRRPDSVIAEAAGEAGSADAWEDSAVVASTGQEASVISSSRASTGLPQISVVLPCAAEGQFAVKTARKIVERTPSEYLREVIVVDDGSEPPIADAFDEDGADEEWRRTSKIRMLRHESTQGLMNAKQTGGDAALGDIYVFFDCHVSPQPNWHREIVQLISENPKRMVVPSITDLDIDTWEEKSDSLVNTKCYLTWDADFNWFEDPSPYVPVMSGGLLALSAEWWKLTGGYDDSMHGWGGENLDQSLRSWLCGGEIMRAPSSRVAHMWRVDSDRRTRAHYTPSGNVRFNKLRVVAAWYGVFNVMHQGFAQLRGTLGDISNIERIKKKLGCRPLVHFLHRFRDIYIDGGVIPLSVFQLRHSSGKCMTTQGAKMALASCQSSSAQASKNPKTWFHWANRDSKKPAGGVQCCSGLRQWGSNNCWDYADEEGRVHNYLCDVTGQNGHQQWRMDHLKRIVQGDGTRCLKEESNHLVLRACGPDSGTWEEILPFEPVEARLYREELDKEGLVDTGFPQ